MKIKHISLLLLPLSAIFVNLYPNLQPNQALHPNGVITYKGLQGTAEMFMNYSDFVDKVHLYLPTKSNFLGRYAYVSFGLLKDFPRGQGADECVNTDREEEVKADFMKKNIDINNLNEGIFYCLGDESNEPALYVQKKGMNISCNEFYTLIKKFKTEQ